MKKTRTFKIVTGNFTRTIAKGFSSYQDAHDWIMMHDYGQYKNEGGWYICPDLF